MAKNYTDNLAEEVKKGMREKARQGYYPLKAPYGYKNNQESRFVDQYEPEAIWVKRAFELYATGNYSLESLRLRLYEEGLRYRPPSRNKISKSVLAVILQNVFYTGDFIFQRQFYKGKHLPIVSMSLFEQVQLVFKKANKPKYTKQEFAFTGLMTCATCGCSISAQIKKGKYIYYHCAQGKGKCKGRYILEREIADQFEVALKRLQITDEALEWIIPVLKSSHQEEIAFHQERVKDLRNRYDRLAQKVDLIYEDKLDGKISEELWLRKHEEYKTEMNHIENSLAQHNRGNLNYIESGTRILELAKRAYPQYCKETPLEQRRILNSLLSNCTLKDGKVEYTYQEPFDLIAQGVKNAKWSG